MIKPLIFIVGPTAIGKSALAIKLAEKLNGEIINADSMQVYLNLNILTARPSKKDQKLIPHHLYGYIDGSIRYNVASWCNDINNIIKKNNKKGIYSIIVGGTGMYVDKLLHGLVQIPSIPESIKKESEKLLLKIGINNFIDKVKNIDEKSLNKISKNDTSRLRRIWEVYKYTNKNFTYWQNNKSKNFLYKPKYHIYLFTPDRNEIYNRVNNRFIKMIDRGAINEVKKLNKLNLDRSLPIMRAHGVPEISSYLEGLITVDECILKGQQVTRNYVKRQITWWKSSKFYNVSIFDYFPSNMDLESLDSLKKIH